MTQKVSEEKIAEFSRRTEKWFEGVRKGSLDPDKVIAVVQRVIDLSATFEHDMRDDGGELIENVGETELFPPERFKLVSFLLEGESTITLEQMVERAKSMRSDFGQSQAEYFLVHQDEIPEEWQGDVLHFPGTIWLDRDDRRCIPYLEWSEEEDCWELGFIELDDDCFLADRLLQLIKVADQH